MDCYKKKEVEPVLTLLLWTIHPLRRCSSLTRSRRPGEPWVKELRPTHQPKQLDSLPDPAVNARRLFAYGNEEDGPKGIKGFLLQEHADTDTSVASLADAHASNHMNGPNNMALYWVWTSLWKWACRSDLLEMRLDVSSERLMGDAAPVLADRCAVTSHQLRETRPVTSN